MGTGNFCKKFDEGERLLRFWLNKKTKDAMNLHIGCGEVYFDGWVNIDKDSEKADKKHDARKRLPYKDNSVDFIYNEHFIEHITVEDAIKILIDFYRVLKPEGVLRIATPDLDYLIEKYISPSWKNQDWIETYGYQWIQTRAEMLNLCFREWGHQYLYNAEELERRLKQAGFEKIYRQKWNESKYTELANRETREDSKLIFEAVK
ncbi:MAG: class I SAM-dependent methyltransferase [Candidatus Helarchaeota archaeon]